MRAIKFRAWHKQERKMYEPTHIGVNGYRAVMSIYTGSTWFTEGHYPDDFELMQFTGLLDKTGKEIYEGDIIHDPLTGKRYPIVFENGAFRTNGLVECSAFPNDEVIGNIYEHPELVGVKP